MSFADERQSGLMSLLAGLQSGLDPTTAYGILQDLQSQQQAHVDQRMQRLGGLSDLLMQAAGSGMPQAGAAALAEAAPGPAGPAVQNMLSALYPTADAQAPAQPMDAQGNPIQAPTGYYDQLGPNGTTPMGTPNVGPTATSPTFMTPQPSPTEAIAMQQAQMDAQTQADWAKVQQQLGAAKAQNKPLDAVLAAMTGNPAYAAVIGQDPAQFQKMIEITYGPQALAMVGMNL